MGKAIKLTTSVFAHKSSALFMCIFMIDLRIETINSGGKGDFWKTSCFCALLLWILLGWGKKKIGNLVKPIFHSILHGMIKCWYTFLPLVNILMLMIGWGIGFGSSCCFHLCFFSVHSIGIGTVCSNHEFFCGFSWQMSKFSLTFTWPCE